MIKRITSIALFVLCITISQAQSCYWQQEADYQIELSLNPENHQFQGEELLTYTNHSPDTLKRVFYHLFFNAFQPGSAMDVRSLHIEDPDKRVGKRISKLKENEIGYHKVLEMTHNGKPVKSNVTGTILEVDLAEPILPGTTHSFAMKFQGQVPKQIRRSGRNNAEGIDYSMTQWYPKIAEYDHQGWHAYEYVGREFHSPWGDYDVKLTLPANYIVAAGGVLQNPDEIGYGYTDKKVKHKKAKQRQLTWHFQTENVIDFAWAADPNYVHKSVQVPNGPLVRYFYNPATANQDAWNKMIASYTIPLFTTMSNLIGEYPYPEYSVIQGGDGGMEYPMATLITGDRSFESLYGVTSHELAHSWFQMMMATNEALYAWMDEGMTSFADDETTAIVFDDFEGLHQGAYRSYRALVLSGKNEPANQHSDYFNTNFAYGVAAYSKGQLLMAQLKYIMGEKVFFDGLRRYYNEWRFKHPTPTDFIRVMEKESGMQLQWFMRNWLNTTRIMDYAVQSVEESDLTESITLVTLESKGSLQIPVEVTVEYNDGRPNELIYIPSAEMFGEKVFPTNKKVKTLQPWNWVHPTYEVVVHGSKEAIKSITIDEQNQTADINRENNIWTQ